MADLAVLLPVRIETRFKNGDLWVRVVPDEPWFLRDDPRISDEELAALHRYADAPREPGPDGVPPAWRTLAAQVGAARAVALHRRFVVGARGGALHVRTPDADERRTGPLDSRIGAFPTELVVWLGDAAGGTRDVLRLTVDRARLLADFPDPDVPDDKRWWENWEEAVAVGVAGIVPAAELTAPIDALYVTGVGDGDPAEHFDNLVAEGRVGLLPPGVATNSVDGAPAAHLANDPETWWTLLHTAPGDADRDVSLALTGDADRLGTMPGGDRPHRAPRAALVTALWPALWGFTLGHVFDVTRGADAARWAGGNMHPEGAFPTLRVGPQPYG